MTSSHRTRRSIQKTATYLPSPELLAVRAGRRLGHGCRREYTIGKNDGCPVRVSMWSAVGQPAVQCSKRVGTLSFLRASEPAGTEIGRPNLSFTATKSSPPAEGPPHSPLESPANTTPPSPVAAMMLK